MSEKVYEQVTATIVEQMQQTIADPGKPWIVLGTGRIPQNAVTGNHYTGGDVLQLAFAAIERGYNSNVWATFNQWNTKDAHVNKGENGTAILFFKTVTKNGEPLQNSDESGTYDPCAGGAGSSSAASDGGGGSGGTSSRKCCRSGVSGVCSVTPD